ncbi:MAG: phospholipase [Phycisphaerales bacterium]|nr:phospholipase [Phycisphaerales bacterium]
MNIRTVLTGVICAGVLGMASSASAGERLKETFEDPALGTMPYNVLLPDTYAATGPKKPLVLFLHGAGERGSDNAIQVDRIIGPLVKETQSGAHQAVLVAPQCALKQTWAAINANNNFRMGIYTRDFAKVEPTSQLQLVMKILDAVEAKYNIDRSRVYITGLSMGGYGTWEAIARYPDRFAAAVPLSGGGNLATAALLKDKPIWAFHGQTDTIVLPVGSTDMVNAIKTENGQHLNENDGNLIYSLNPTEGHGGWQVFYAGKYYKTDGGLDQPPGKSAAKPSTASTSAPAPAPMPASKAGSKGLYDWLFSKALPAQRSK